MNRYTFLFNFCFIFSLAFDFDFRFIFKISSNLFYRLIFKFMHIFFYTAAVLFRIFGNSSCFCNRYTHFFCIFQIGFIGIFNNNLYITVIFIRQFNFAYTVNHFNDNIFIMLIQISDFFRLFYKFVHTVRHTHTAYIGF